MRNREVGNIQDFPFPVLRELNAETHLVILLFKALWHGRAALNNVRELNAETHNYFPSFL